jgi:hypothetical protein
MSQPSETTTPTSTTVTLETKTLGRDLLVVIVEFWVFFNSSNLSATWMDHSNMRQVCLENTISIELRINTQILIRRLEFLSRYTAVVN